VWDETLGDHLTSGSTGAGLNAAGSAGDPWSTTLPGAYGSGSAGYILGTNLNATVSSRLASSSYTAPPSASTNATAVRSELTTELGRIDATISSRLATSGYTAPLDAAGTRSAVGLASANLDTQLNALPTAAENADAVWDEAYSGHTTAGSFGKLLDTLRKANYVTEGSVAAGGTPTTTVFRTNLTEPTGTFDNQTLLFISGDLAGESAPIEAYSVTNGQITLGDALTQAPTAADEFVILADHVHPLSEIATAVYTGQMSESYRAAGVAPTLAQALFELIAQMGDRDIVGQTLTLHKLDGTAAKTFSLNDANNPTSITEAT
jgi:hypothetical protein